MKLIQVSEAAKRLGISRQTLENWGHRGYIRIREVGSRCNGHWVDEDAINALGDTIQDVEDARKQLESEHSKLVADYKREREIHRDISRELYIIGSVGSPALAKEFYLTIPEMLVELGLIKAREAEIMRMVIEGKETKEIANRFGLTRARVTQIFYKACRKARNMELVRENLKELNSLREEVREFKGQLQVLSRGLKVQQEAEMELREMQERERVEYIKKTDSLLKVLNTPIIECDLSVRTKNCLHYSEIKTIGDIAKCREIDFLKLRNFGKKSLAELADFLRSLNLSFGINVDKIYHDRIAQRLMEIDEG